MARNVALFGRREFEAHKRTIIGVTASVPRYVDIDTDGNKEWVVDVFLGPLERIKVDIVKDVPIAPYARQLVTDLHQPIEIERTKQGQYQVVGRSKILIGGAQTTEGSILDPTYHDVRHNLANLRLQFLADLDYTFEELQDDPGTVLQADPEEPLQNIDGFNAFGKQVLGEGATVTPAVVDPDPDSTTTTIHCRLVMAKLGPKGDPLAMDFGISELQPVVKEKIELVS